MDVKHFCHVVTNVRETIHADIAVNRIAMQVTVEILNYARKRSKLRVRVKNKKKSFRVKLIVKAKQFCSAIPNANKNV